MYVCVCFFRMLSNVEVGTVDSYQGRESDIIVFSCTRSEGIGFMANMERLNVALTRARHSLVIIGNFKSLQVYSRLKLLSFINMMM